MEFSRVNPHKPRMLSSRRVRRRRARLSARPARPGAPGPAASYVAVEVRRATSSYVELRRRRGTSSYVELRRATSSYVELRRRRRSRPTPGARNPRVEVPPPAGRDPVRGDLLRASVQTASWIRLNSRAGAVASRACPWRAVVRGPGAGGRREGQRTARRPREVRGSGGPAGKYRRKYRRGRGKSQREEPRAIGPSMDPQLDGGSRAIRWSGDAGE